MFNKRIYLDYASLTPIDPRVLREMGRFSISKYANPSSIYKEGFAAKEALDSGRKKIAGFIHAHPDEMIFTSGGTEANALALEGVFNHARKQGIEKPHLIISAIEHSSIIETADALGKQGCEVTRLAVDSSGLISLSNLKKSIKPNTFMVSIMTVNNEIGTIQPIKEIAKIIRQARVANSNTKNDSENNTNYPLFHTDAAQAVLYQELNMESMGVDLMTLDSSKMYGPRGMGALYIRRNTPIEPIIHGGGQEKGIRSGTENIPAIMGFAKACEIAATERTGKTTMIEELRSSFIAGLKSIRSDIRINGVDGASQSPHILNVSIPGIDNEFFVLQLDAQGIACSTKSSCLRDADESYVLQAIGVSSKDSVRFSFGRFTKKKHVTRSLKIIRDVLLFLTK